MLHFEGTKDLALPAAQAHAQLSDARFLAQALPGDEAVRTAEADHFVMTVRPGFSFARGTLEVTFRIVEAVPPTTIRYHVHGKGIGSSNDVEATVTLSPHEQGTRAHWVVDITHLGGLLKAVPQGLIKAAAQKVIEDLWTAVARKLA